MSNPDERTAIDQFGTDDKYFGVATLMATLPGLPMFGHGQVEGFAEKYGMEFRRPRWDEEPDEDLIRRHERQLFPLLHRRGSFAEVDRFLLYDFADDQGRVDENVFAYSNEVGGQRSLVIFHNTFADTRGWLRRSTAKLVREADGSERLERFSLAQGLGITGGDGRYLAFKDVVDGLEYLRPCRGLAEDGLYVELDAYRCHVFLDFREFADDDEGRLRMLETELTGRGVDSIDLALAELDHRDVLEPLSQLVSAENLKALSACLSDPAAAADGEMTVGEMLPLFVDLMAAMAAREGVRNDPGDVVLALRRDLERALLLPDVGDAAQVAPLDQGWWASVFAWLLIRRLGEVVDRSERRQLAIGWFDEWLFGRVIERQLQQLGLESTEAGRVVDTIRLLLAVEGWWATGDDEIVDLAPVMAELVSFDPGRTHLGVNRWDGVLWYQAEAFDELVRWLRVVAMVETWDDPGAMEAVDEALERLNTAGEACGCRVAELLKSLAGR